MRGRDDAQRPHSAREHPEFEDEEDERYTGEGIVGDDEED